jgi:peptidoglycan hydrolase-like protein with peptidoglycan-binding domain
MPKATIQLGAQGDDVMRVQRYFVRAKALAPSHLDGDFGPETDGLVRQFQQDNGLVVDGIVGPQTKASVQAFQGGGTGVVDEPTWFAPVGAAGLTLEGLAGMTTFGP